MGFLDFLSDVGNGLGKLVSRDVVGGASIGDVVSSSAFSTFLDVVDYGQVFLRENTLTDDMRAESSILSTFTTDFYHRIDRVDGVFFAIYPDAPAFLKYRHENTTRENPDVAEIEEVYRAARFFTSNRGLKFYLDQRQKQQKSATLFDRAYDPSSLVTSTPSHGYSRVFKAHGSLKSSGDIIDRIVGKDIGTTAVGAISAIIGDPMPGVSNYEEMVATYGSQVLWQSPPNVNADGPTPGIQYVNSGLDVVTESFKLRDPNRYYSLSDVNGVDTQAELRMKKEMVQQHFYTGAYSVRSQFNDAAVRPTFSFADSIAEIVVSKDPISTGKSAINRLLPEFLSASIPWSKAGFGGGVFNDTATIGNAIERETSIYYNTYNPTFPYYDGENINVVGDDVQGVASNSSRLVEQLNVFQRYAMGPFHPKNWEVLGLSTTIASLLGGQTYMNQVLGVHAIGGAAADYYEKTRGITGTGSQDPNSGSAMKAANGNKNLPFGVKQAYDGYKAGEGVVGSINKRLNVVSDWVSNQGDSANNRVNDFLNRSDVEKDTGHSSIEKRGLPDKTLAKADVMYGLDRINWLGLIDKNQDTTASTPLDHLGKLADGSGVSKSLDMEQETVETSPESNRYPGAPRGDFIPFFFEDTIGERTVVFRALLDGGINENISAGYNQVTYQSRAETFYRYSNFGRTVAFSFKIIPFSEAELQPLWDKLSYLASLTSPHVKRIDYGGYLVPPLVKLTIGDLYSAQPGLINNLTVNAPDGTPWDIRNPEEVQHIRRLPMYLDVNVSYTIIEKAPPRVGSVMWTDERFIRKRHLDSQPPRVISGSDAPLNGSLGDDNPALVTQREIGLVLEDVVLASNMNTEDYTKRK